MPASASAAPVRPEPSPAPPRLSQRIISAVSVTGIGSVLTMLAGTLANIAVARNGGPRGFATFVAANMLVFVTAAFCEASMALALAKYVAAEEEAGEHEMVRRMASTVLCVLALIGLIVGALVAANLRHLENALGVSYGSNFALVFPFVLVITLISYGAIGLYTGLLRPRMVLAITLAGPLSMLAYVLLRRIGQPLPLWGAVATSYTCSGLVAFYGLWRDRLPGRPLPLRELRPVVRELLPTSSFTFFTIFSTWSDRWIVGTQLGPIPLGLYAAAVAVIQAALRLPNNVAYLMVPAAAKVARRDSSQNARFSEEVLRVAGYFAMLVLIVLLLAAPVLVRLMFGPGFAAAIPALMLMTPSLVAAAITIPFLASFTGAHAAKRTTLLLMLTVPVRLSLLYVLTSLGGVAGTALATALADCALAIFCIYLSRRQGIPLPLHALREPFTAALPALVVGGLVLWVGGSSLLAAVLGLLLFLPFLWRAFQHGRARLANRVPEN